MSSFGLNTALSGLALAQQQIDLISNNVVNASTAGYTRKILPQDALAPNGIGSGVISGNIFRNSNLHLAQNIWTQVSSASGLTVKETYLNDIARYHGASEAESSISAEIARLKADFVKLSGNPSDALAQKSVVDQALDTAAKFNDFANYITTLRNNAQNDIGTTVKEINALLDNIASSNQEIVKGRISGNSTAAIEDVRDQTLNELAELIEIDYYELGDGTMVIQTNQGIELASDTATPLTFEPSMLSAENSYPDNIAGVFVGDPNQFAFAVDLTSISPGGKLGALLELRDETFTKQMAQLDELAFQMASRFSAQGLDLFTSRDGTLPQGTPPDLTTDPVTPVDYIGFARDMRVNEAILNDHTLLQRGTSADVQIPHGEAQLISRILDHTFGSVDYQTAAGNIDLAVSGLAAPNNSLQQYLGLRAQSEVKGATNLSGFNNVTDFLAATNGAIGPTSNSFRFTFEESDLGLGPISIDITLDASIPDGPGGFSDDLINHINNSIISALPAAQQTALNNMGVQFSVSAGGQIQVTANADITLDSTSPANAIGDAGLAMLGLASGTTEAEDPYFDIAVGTNDFTRITIEPSDTEADLLAKLNNIEGLAVRLNPTTGALELRPGNSFTDPDFGGSLRIVSGQFSTNNAGANGLLGAGSVPDGINVVSALFGSFTNGTPAHDRSPIENVLYGQDVSANDPSHVAFRKNNLGPNGRVSTNIATASDLIDFAQRMINEHSQELLDVTRAKKDTTTFRNLLQEQLSNETGVNIDEEMSHLVVVQTSYAASARVVNAIQELLDELFRIF